MVGVVTGAGASSMQIRSGLDTSNIEAGFRRVRSGFDSVKGHAKGLTSDFKRMSIASGELVHNMSKLGLVGVSAIIGIASRAPAVAPAIAKMGVAFDRITRSLGRALMPVFERLAVHLNNLSNWVSAHESEIRTFATTLLDWGETIGKILYPALSKVGSWAAEHPKLFAGIFAGITLGPIALSAITAFTGLITTLTTAIVAPAVLTALAHLAVIAAAGGVSFKIGHTIGDITYESIGKPFVTSDIGGGIARTFLKIKDFLTGGAELAEFESAFYNWKQNQTDREYLLNPPIDKIT